MKNLNDSKSNIQLPVVINTKHGLVIIISYTYSHSQDDNFIGGYKKDESNLKEICKNQLGIECPIYLLDCPFDEIQESINGEYISLLIYIHRNNGITISQFIYLSKGQRFNKLPLPSGISNNTW